MSKGTVEKAQRLHQQGRVTEQTMARVFHVQGDRGSYLVVIADTATCTCPSTGTCSHITAVLLTIREQAADTAH